jgi:hypothetical protein
LTENCSGHQNQKDLAFGVDLRRFGLQLLIQKQQILAAAAAAESHEDIYTTRQTDS